MCGIFGIIGKQQNFQNQLDSIKHRGPDDEGAYYDENISLGFRRLSIIDLSPRGHQPMTNENGTIWLVFNGEIYNFKDLRKQLVSSHKFSSETDSEVLIHGYEEWGINGLLERVNGMFAFCLYDKTRHVSYLARDRIGKKPLYYYESPDYIAFSSEAKAFFTLPEFSFSLDEAMFDLFMGFSYLPNNEKTILRGVYKIPPAHFMEISQEGDRTQRYWRLPEQTEDITFEDAKTQLKELLEDAVKKRLVSDVPLGVLLSGGLDSSLITALASGNSQEQIKTITVSFEDSCIDERSYAQTVADHCHTEHHSLHLKVENAYEEFRNNLWIYDDLSTVDGGLFSEYLIAKKLREDGIKVVLVGEGADEIFGGYTYFQLSQLPFSLMPETLRFYGYYYILMRTLNASRVLKYSGKFSSLLREFDGDFFHKVQRYEILYSLPNHYCMKVDKGTSAASVEARSPFMDYRVVELAAKLKMESFLKDYRFSPKESKEKHILREIAKDLLPQQISTRKKKGGMLPMGDILNEGIKKDRDLIVKNPYLSDFYGNGYLQNLMDSDPKSAPLIWQREWILWKCLIFSLWENFYVSKH